MQDALKPAQVIDGHCHVPSTMFIPKRFLADVAGNIYQKLQTYGMHATRRRVEELLINENQDHQADELVKEMDDAGISETVLLVPDFSFALECELMLHEMVERHHQLKRQHAGRFRVFVGADPRRVEDGVNFFRRCVDDWSLDGLKLYPPCGYSPSDERLFPYYRLCAERDLPVLLHTGPTAQSLSFRFAQPMLIEDAARHFPSVPFILAHGGVTWHQECCFLAAYRENIYIDIGGFTGAIVPDSWQKHLNRLFRSGISHKIIFGTDWPINKMSGGLKRLLAEFAPESAVFDGIGKRDQELIMGGNIRRLLSMKQ